MYYLCESHGLFQLDKQPKNKVEKFLKIETAVKTGAGGLHLGQNKELEFIL